MFQLFDANRDGGIDAAEFAAAADRLKSLDRNADGRVTPQEFNPNAGGGNRPQRPQDEGQPRGARPRED